MCFFVFSSQPYTSRVLAIGGVRVFRQSFHPSLLFTRIYIPSAGTWSAICRAANADASTTLSTLSVCMYVYASVCIRFTGNGNASSTQPFNDRPSTCVSHRVFSLQLQQQQQQLAPAPGPTGSVAAQCTRRRLRSGSRPMGGVPEGKSGVERFISRH